MFKSSFVQNIINKQFPGHAFFSENAVNPSQHTWVEAMLREAKSVIDQRLAEPQHCSNLQGRLLMPSPSGGVSILKQEIDEILREIFCDDFLQPCFTERNVNRHHYFFIKKTAKLTECQATELKRFIHAELEVYIKTQLDAKPSVTDQPDDSDSDYAHMIDVLGGFDEDLGGVKNGSF
jgi:hypothetical protein